MAVTGTHRGPSSPRRPPELLRPAAAARAGDVPASRWLLRRLVAVYYPDGEFIVGDRDVLLILEGRRWRISGSPQFRNVEARSCGHPA